MSDVEVDSRPDRSSVDAVNGYLLIISDRQALGWILTTSRTAFSDPIRKEVRGLRPKDLLVLYTTRGCFKNPTRDRGRIVGQAEVVSEVTPSPEPLRFGERSFPYVCTLRLTALAPFGSGPELAPHASSLNALRPSGAGWATRLRRSLMPLDEHDQSYLRSLPDYPTQRPTATLKAPYARWVPQSGPPAR